jgi:transcription antitermination factor NusG
MAKIHTIDFDDDAGDPRACLSEGEYVVLEPVAADLSALESELAAMKAKVAEMERQLAEALEAKRKREEAAKWAAIGRKPGEFKVGDIVKITKYQFGHAEGSIVEVTEAYGSFVKVSGIHRGTLYTFDADIDCVELIAPVESVVNLRGGDVA